MTRQRRDSGGADSTCGSNGLLDYPHYTRPAEFRGIAVPEALMSGNHEEIRRWRRQRALEKTLRNRPDLLEGAELSEEESKFLAGIKNAISEIRIREGFEKENHVEPNHRKTAGQDSTHRHSRRFIPGDTVRVHVKIKEGDKERVQAFEGVVIKRDNGPQASFTVRKISFGQGVERIFPVHSKVIDKVDLLRSSKVRRAKLYYLRGLKGKAARLRDVERPA